MNKPSLYDSPRPAFGPVLARFRRELPRSKHVPHVGAKQLAKAARRFRSGPPTGVGGFAGEDLP